MLAKVPKLTYDGRVKKAFVFVLSILTLFALGYFSFPKAYALSSPGCLKFEGEKCILVDTAIGKISTEPQKFVQGIFGIVLGLAGGIALILVMLAGYRFMASQGDPEKINDARQQLISAIVGLLFIIFSFVILQVIGVDILKIPGFNP